MSMVRKAVSALGGIFLAALLIAALAPKAAHGLVAALVQVTNTAAAPAITQDVSRLASQSVQLICVGPSDCSQVLPDGSSPAPFYTVPAGCNLVITTVQINMANSGVAELHQLSNSGFWFREDWTLPAGGSFQFEYPSGIVFSSGSNLGFVAFTPPFVEAYLTGYLVSN